MKRIAIVVVMVLMSMAASARSVHYFTFSQASRTVSYLNAQNELMIYCGYDYEIETYVLVNEVWMERINSAYYEIWVFGYDAYTGDEIYMPLDLQCVWLFSGNRMYNAAQYLRFHTNVVKPTFIWHIPPYNPYTRVAHRHGYSRTYHYSIHRHGWMPPAYTHGPGAPPPPLPPYYMRTPQQPAPTPTAPWTPGMNRPTVPASATAATRDNNPTTGRQVSSSHNTSSSGPATTGNRGTTTRVSSNASENSGTSRSNASTASSRSNSSNASATPTRSTATSRTSNSTATSNSRSSSTAAASNASPTRSAANSSRNSSSRSSNATSTSSTSSTCSAATSSSSRSASRSDDNGTKDNSSSNTRSSSSRSTSTSRNTR